MRRALLLLILGAGPASAQVRDTTPFLWNSVPAETRLRLRTSENTVVGRYDRLVGQSHVLLDRCERGCLEWGAEEQRVPLRAIFSVDLHRGSYLVDGVMAGGLVGLLTGGISGFLLAAGNESRNSGSRMMLGSAVGGGTGAIFGAILGATHRKWIPLGRVPRATSSAPPRRRSRRLPR